MTSSESSLARLEGLLAEQAALRRVATLVAADPHAGRLFAGVCEEVGRVLDVQSTNITRFEDDGTYRVRVTLHKGELNCEVRSNE